MHNQSQNVTIQIPALALHQRFQGRNTDISLLGQGSFGKIYLLKDNAKHKYSVLKEILIKHLSAEDKKTAMEEAMILSQLNHPNICSFIDSFIGEPYGDHLYIIMEYANGGDLRKEIKKRNLASNPFSELEVQTIILQCSLGLQHIHDVNIIHRDIKSENIFLHDNGRLIKVGDFGIAKVLDKTNGFAETMVGTPYYFSPELCEDRPYGKMSDIWALGCVFYETLQLDLPFKAKSLPLLVHKIMNAESDPLPSTYPLSLRSLVQSMLNKSSTKRPTADIIVNHDSLKIVLSQYQKQEISKIPNNIQIKKHPRAPKDFKLNKTSPIQISKDAKYRNVQLQGQVTVTKPRRSQQQKNLSQKSYRTIKSWEDCLKKAEKNVIGKQIVQPYISNEVQTEEPSTMKSKTSSFEKAVPEKRILFQLESQYITLRGEKECMIKESDSSRNLCNQNATLSAKQDGNVESLNTLVTRLHSMKDEILKVSKKNRYIAASPCKSSAIERALARRRIAKQ